jgi:hypothetical protein
MEIDMIHEKPYVYFKFIGVKSFTALLNDVGVRYVLFDDEAVRHIYHARPDYFNASDDFISTGKCTQEDAGVYFAEFGIKITPSFRSHVVFIYDHHPTADEMLVSAEDIETLIQKNLDGVNLEDIQRNEEDLPLPQ